MYSDRFAFRVDKHAHLPKAHFKINGFLNTYVMGMKPIFW
jgi:hypothetical protein